MQPPRPLGGSTLRNIAEVCPLLLLGQDPLEEQMPPPPRTGGHWQAGHYAVRTMGLEVCEMYY